MTNDELRDTLDTLELTQRAGARLLGVHERSVRHWIMGDRPIPETVVRLLRLCQAMPAAYSALERMARETPR